MKFELISDYAVKTDLRIDLFTVLMLSFSGPYWEENIDNKGFNYSFTFIIGGIGFRIRWGRVR